MKVIVGTYRGRAYLDLLIGELENNVLGIDELIFVDDSGDRSVRKWASDYGQVYPVAETNAGYTRAMQTVCGVMQETDDDYVMFWEEDFLPAQTINLSHLADELQNDPTLAQVVLPRQPWFDNELECGDMITAMEKRLDKPVIEEKGLHETLWVHQAQFSCNPAVWAPVAYQDGWPQVQWSEDCKTQQLVEVHEVCFAFYGRDVKVRHYGKRTGTGY